MGINMLKRSSKVKSVSAVRQQAALQRLTPILREAVSAAVAAYFAEPLAVGIELLQSEVEYITDDAIRRANEQLEMLANGESSQTKTQERLTGWRAP